MFEGEYYDGILWNGKGKRYNRSGELYFEGEYLNGKKNGKIKEWSGKTLLFEGQYLNGNKFGMGKEYNYDGKLKYEGEFQIKIIKGKEYYEDNKYRYKSDNSIDKFDIYADDINNDNIIDKAKIISDNSSKNSNDDGNVKENEEILKLKYEGDFFDGDKIKGKEYDENGQLIFEGIYIEDKKYKGI